MVITINLNPALDRTIYIHNTLKPTAINRATHSHVEAGGRGIHVSRAVKALGGDSLALGFCAGTNGRFMKEYLMGQDIHHAFVDVPGNTRINLKVIDENGDHTDINEPGVTIFEGDFLRLLERIEAVADEKATFVIAGSLPPKFTTVNFGKICRTIRKAGARLIVDTEGEYLVEALKYAPDFVRVTRPALAAITGEAFATEPDPLAIQARKLVQLGAVGVMVTTPKDGAVFAHRDHRENLYITSSQPRRDNGVFGVSAAMLGALAEYSSRGLDYIELCKITVASGFASAKLAGSEMASLKRVFENFESMLVYTL